MIAYPGSKINLGLKVLNKRRDGFHNLESVFIPVPLYDALEIVVNKNNADPKIIFTSGGAAIPGDMNSNLCIKAYSLLDGAFNLPPIKMHLHKVIPMGAGLGGGSSDGASTLKLLNDIFHLKLSTTQLKKFALQLGSDCPFFISNTPSFVTGRGDKLKKINIDLNGMHIVIVHPGVHISTADAFRNIHPARYKHPLIDLPDWKIRTWPMKVENDFEGYAFAKYPLLKKIKETLYAKGARYASMSGSGSAIYGLFEEKIKIPKAWEGFFVFQAVSGE